MKEGRNWGEGQYMPSEHQKVRAEQDRDTERENWRKPSEEPSPTHKNVEHSASTAQTRKGEFFTHPN
ncbi:hypothetical protein NDU88_000938 [Pleurodeles waltl]|uniref:Uncharacterized protein n=1 Tax=Pleurodeles waltl TaxID=8319 RepID=A0AAV7N9E1_PLEWA|nr:hypothetical protein NDU88_000938 [Pleurodeles waltl]